MTIHSPEYRANQQERIKQIRLHEDTHARVQKYAEDNAMSVSEALREVMELFVTDAVPPVRKRRTKRISVWFTDVKDYLAFANKAKKEGLTIGEAVDSALEKYI